MTDRPILFSGPMVRAILAGSKTVTRRIVKPQPIPIPPDDEFSPYSKWHPSGFWWQCHAGQTMLSIAEMGDFGVGPYGGKGSRLWVRETFAVTHRIDATPGGQPYDPFVRYQATDDGAAPLGLQFEPFRWKPSIHMPRKLARLLLDVASVRVERLHDITEEDARAEGVTPFPLDPEGDCWTDGKHRTAFEYLWGELNGRTGDKSWDVNPWVWRVEFRKAGE